jgi:hypothetical protein
MKVPSISSLAMVLALVASRAFKSSAQEDSHLRGSHDGKGIESGSIDCLLLEGDALRLVFEQNIFKKTHEPFWCCQDEDLLLYEIQGLGSQFFKDKHAVSGHDFMRAPQAEKVRNSGACPQLKIAADSHVSIVRNENRRHLAPKTGINTLLVIRGISLDGAPTNSSAQLADDVIDVKGGGTDTVNLVTQYNACSNGMLQYKPATGNTNITNGVVEVFVNKTLTNVDWMTAYNYFVTEALSVVGPLSQWTQVMFILQSTVDFQGSLARGYLSDWQTIIKDSSASSVMIQMHELGHNLGMRHSAEGNNQVGDSTCMMGTNQFYYDDAPLQCFNAAKSWFLGWYNDRHITVTPTISSWDGLVAGIDDYLKGQTTEGKHYVLVKFEDTTNSTDLYLMYNRKEGVNSGVLEYPNNVNIVAAVNGITSDLSNLVAHLSAGEVYRASKFSGQAADLVVKVCNMVNGTPDFSRVLVYLDNGIGNLSCETPAPMLPPTPNPTLTPTLVLTTAPTPDVTPAPTLDPTLATTPAPTLNPTPDLTPNPTPDPTLAPMLNQTPAPTPNPTLDPTPSLTPAPTPNQTLITTPAPTPNPTMDPTLAPTPDPT